ncbi:MAG: permease [Candidatus Izemoplasmatales bacterium]
MNNQEMNYQTPKSDNMMQNKKKNPLKKWLSMVVVVLAFVIVFIIDKEKGVASVTVTWDYFKEMFLILPPVFILMGLIEVWLPKEKIQSWLGNESGIKGILLSIGLATLPTGPLYIAFPMTATLLKKGASIRNMVLFLGTWAALKIPQLMVEIEFLGFWFTALRFGLTLIGLLIIGYFIEYLMKKEDNNLGLSKSI